MAPTLFVDDAYLSPNERQNLQQKVLQSEKAKHKSLTTAVQVYGNQVVVPVEVSEGQRQISARLLLDTGASQTVFHHRVVTPLRTKLLGKGWSRLAGGQLIATDRVRLESLTVGPDSYSFPDRTQWPGRSLRRSTRYGLSQETPLPHRLSPAGHSLAVF